MLYILAGMVASVDIRTGKRSATASFVETNHQDERDGAAAAISGARKSDTPRYGTALFNRTIMGTTTSFNNTPQAGDDFFTAQTTGLTEDSLFVTYLAVMANDLGGAAKTLYSLDDASLGEVELHHGSAGKRSAMKSPTWSEDSKPRTLTSPAFGESISTSSMLSGV
jgi:hypothetical protein